VAHAYSMSSACNAATHLHGIVAATPQQPAPQPLRHALRLAARPALASLMAQQDALVGLGGRGQGQEAGRGVPAQQVRRGAAQEMRWAGVMAWGVAHG
jgi:hypothetical protein